MSETRKHAKKFTGALALFALVAIIGASLWTGWQSDNSKPKTTVVKKKPTGTEQKPDGKTGNRAHSDDEAVNQKPPEKPPDTKPARIVITSDEDKELRQEIAALQKEKAVLLRRLEQLKLAHQQLRQNYALYKAQIVQYQLQIAEFKGQLKDKDTLIAQLTTTHNNGEMVARNHSTAIIHEEISPREIRPRLVLPPPTLSAFVKIGPSVEKASASVSAKGHITVEKCYFREAMQLGAYSSNTGLNFCLRGIAHDLKNEELTVRVVNGMRGMGQPQQFKPDNFSRPFVISINVPADELSGVKLSKSNLRMLITRKDGTILANSLVAP